MCGGGSVVQPPGADSVAGIVLFPESFQPGVGVVDHRLVSLLSGGSDDDSVIVTAASAGIIVVAFYNQTEDGFGKDYPQN